MNTENTCYDEDSIKGYELMVAYCDDGMRELKKLCYPLISSYGGLYQKDYDDFYSIANSELLKCASSYDDTKGASFETYLYHCIDKKFKTEMTRRNRIKRGAGQQEISLDAQYDDDDLTLGEILDSGKRVEEDVSDKDDKVHTYIASLSPKQQIFAELLMEGHTIESAQHEMGISAKELDNMLKHMRSYEKTRLLTNNDYIGMEDEEMANQTTLEKSKMEKYSVLSLSKKMDNCTINFDHPLQRHADQWTNRMKSDLVSDILQGNPIPALVFAEQVINGVSIIFDLDGKQRCTTAKEYLEDKFKVVKSVHRSLITYQAILKDEDGKVQVDESGFPIAEMREFDITNKKFSQLPTELQERFLDYCFDVTLYLNCSDDDIAYHITRYNQGKAMNAVQKGVINLGEDFARMVKSVAAMPFFQDNGFTFKQFNNGTLDRVCIETVMATEFLDDWKKSPEDISSFLNQNATEEMFEDLEDTVERIQNVITDETSDLFNAKDAFIWLTLFNRFKSSNVDDSIFGEFLQKFCNELHSVEVDGVSFDSLGANKNTKDKVMVVAKLDLLSSFLSDFVLEEVA